MPITWDPDARTFHLHNGQLSYLIGVLDNGTLGQLHFGGPLAAGRSYAHLAGREFLGFDNRLGQPVPLEYPSTGTGDYRIPAIVVEQPDGSTALDLRYAGHRIVPGKPGLPGLPATYVEGDGEADTLEILLVDVPADLEVRLLYTLFAGRPAIDPQRPDPECRPLPPGDPLRDEPEPGPARQRVGAAPAERLVGA